MVIGVIESFFWCLNEALVVVDLGLVDAGGTMVIHMFGAYFGLSASYFFRYKEALKCK